MLRLIEMRAGALIDYELTLYTLPLRWRTLIEAFDRAQVIDERFG